MTNFAYNKSVCYNHFSVRFIWTYRLGFWPESYHRYRLLSMIIVIIIIIIIIIIVVIIIVFVDLVSLDKGAKMSPKRRTLLSLVFSCICLSKSLLITIIIIVIVIVISNFSFHQQGKEK